MKKIFSIVTLAAMLGACNSNPKPAAEAAPSVTAPDTSTANHNAFSDTAKEVKLNGVSDTIVGNDGNAYVKVKPKEAEVTPVKKEATAVHHTVAHTKRTSTAASGSTSSKSGTGSSTVAKGDSTQTTTTTTTTTTAPAKKKRWSKAATDAAIGAGAGAAAGAIISKKKGTGAIIGGVIGGAGGYIFGKSKDKKDKKEGNN